MEGIGEANQTPDGVLASDMLIAGVETTVIMSMDLKQKLEDYLKNGGATLDQMGLFTGGSQNGIMPDTTNTVRWPSDTIHEDTDYVFFNLVSINLHLPETLHNYETILDGHNMYLKN